MADVLTKKQRSFCMSRIKCKDTKLELIFAKMLRKARIRGYRREYKIEGKPDFVFLKHRVAIFLDGCFWHQCPRCYQKPATNTGFWEKKIAGNRKRDSKVNKALKCKGWVVKRFWGHQIKKDPEKTAVVLKKILDFSN